MVNSNSYKKEEEKSQEQQVVVVVDVPSVLMPTLAWCIKSSAINGYCADITLEILCIVFALGGTTNPTNPHFDLTMHM
eukprot:901444-Ditylum_brightwellii.AAC.1